MNSEFYNKTADGTWEDLRDDEAYLELLIKNGYDIELVGIVRPNPEAAATALSGTFGYTNELTRYVVEKSAESAIVKEQLLPENANYDVLTGLPFVITEDINPTNAQKVEKFKAYAQTLNSTQKTSLYTDIISTPAPEELEQTVNGFLQQYPTRESMIELVVTTYKFDKTAAEEYVASYSDDELRDMLRKRVENLVKEKYAEQAALQIAQMKATVSNPNDLFGAEGYAAVATAFDRMMETATDEALLAGYYDSFMPSAVSDSTLAETLLSLGAIDYDTPMATNIYAATFEDKEVIDKLISDYNADAPEEDKISYTDYVGILMSGVTTMIDAVSYGLIGFVSISLVVSSDRKSVV